MKRTPRRWFALRLSARLRLLLGAALLLFVAHGGGTANVAVAQSDSTPPSSTITSIDSDMRVVAGRPFTISGTASDAGGGTVARVEVSLDGGITWQQARGGTSWSYTWTPALSAVGPVILRSRAVDNSNNFELPSAGTMVDVVAPPDPNAGPGGPVLVVTSATNPFTKYYAEIFRAEGLNAFTVADVETLTSLAAYDVVILGEMPLTGTQVTMFTNWVNDGGNLIAMRPDPGLYPLLGLTNPPSGALSNAYLLFNTSTGPGAGLVNTPIQFHGTADLATPNGASTIAMLYSNPTTATTNPAVTLRSVGTSGGQAAAFLYDLARSIVYTRQGNPAWSGQERDGIAPVRSSDLFYGAAATDPQPDWINLNKVEIPQADEQQRLLANLVLQVSADRKPLPRFWYFPRGEKAVVVMTGDDHANGGTTGRFEQYKAFSAPGCSVDDWECIRSTSYIYPSTPLTNAQASAFDAEGFEVWLHLDTGCANWTPESLRTFYDAQIATMQSNYPGLPSGVTHRAHCIAWSDYATQPRIELERGIRFDTNYYYWPKEWVANRPGFFTGSGMPMRFADVDLNGSGGTMIDVYQAATQMTDESGQTYAFTVDRLLDRALGPQAFYGAFTANMHTDFNSFSDPNQALASSNAIIGSAQARGVPVVSSRQMLEWLDGRNSSSFGTIGWNGSTLSFNIAVGAGGRGLQAMLPTRSGALTLMNITRESANVPYTVETIKGVEYAIFAASPGPHAAVYTVDTFPPLISGVTAAATATTALITWSTNEISTSGVVVATSPSLGSCTLDANFVTSHSRTLTGLTPTTTYYYRVCSSDPLGNIAIAPPVGDPPSSFTTPSLSFTDTTFDDFSAGTPGSSTYVAATGDGEVILAPQLGLEFSGTTLPAGWSIVPWTVGGGATVSGGVLTVDGARVSTDALYSPGRSLEMVATFAGDMAQHIGFGQNLETVLFEQWALFSTREGGQGLWARTNVNGVQTETQILASVPFGAHRYRIDWNPSSILYYLDGVQVATHPVVIAAPMRPIAASDFVASQGTVVVDWLRMGPATSSGAFVSRVFDAGGPGFWGALSWTGQTLAGTNLALSVRTGETPTPDANWSSFVPIAVPGGMIGGSSRYIQYRAQLSTSSVNMPVLEQVNLGYGTAPPGPDTTPPTISDIAITPTTQTATVAWKTNEPANSAVAYGLSPAALTNTVADSTPTALHGLTLVGLTANTTYYYRVTSADPSGNSATLPPLTEAPASFITPAPTPVTFVDTTAADFSAGTPGTATYVAETVDGEVILAPFGGAEFSGTTLPTGWQSQTWSGGGSVTVANGRLTVDGMRTTTAVDVGSNRSIEFMATFASDGFQHIGFAKDLSFNTPFAIFSTSGGGGLFTRTLTSSETSTPLSGAFLNSPHRYRIDWGTATATFSIDGTVVATHAFATADTMIPVVSDFTVGNGTVNVDWLRVTPYPPSGTFQSRVFDAGTPVNWGTLSWTADLPSGTAVALSVRTGSSPVLTGNYTAIPASGGAIGGSSRYLQYQAVLTRVDPATTPALRDVTIAATPASAPNTSPVAGNISYSTNEDVMLDVTAPGVLLGASDVDGNPLVAVLVGGPATGTLTLNQNGSFIYQPASNVNGTDTFTYKVNDGIADSNIATVTITINPVNDAPSFVKGLDQAVAEDDPAQTVTGWATSIGGGPANESSQTVTFLVTTDDVALFSAQPAIATNGTLTFRPAPNASGTAVVTVKAQDNGGTTNGGIDTSAAQTFTISVVAVNDAPGFDVIANQTSSEDALSSDISITGVTPGPADEAGQTVMVTATSSNPAIVPNPTVNGAGSTRTLSYQPVGNANGSVTITVTATDGQSANNVFTRTFTIDVAAVNDPPAFDVIANQTANEDAPATNVSITNVAAGPANESAQSVTFTASSSNPAIVPDPSVSGTGATRTLTYQPVANANGTVTITVTANDGQAANNTLVRTFTITINPVNDDPTIADIANQTTPQGVTLGPVSFTVGDIDSPVGSLIVSGTSNNQTLVPNGNIAFGGSNPNRTLTITPAAGQNGTATITVTVTDSGGATGSDTFVLTVTALTSTTTSAPTSSLSTSTYGQNVTFTTTVTGSGGPPAGTVTFYDNGVALGTATLSSGTASLMTNQVAAGTRSITATYNGNSTFASSTSGAFTQTVNKATTTSTLTLLSSPRQYSDLLTYEATVSTVNGQLPAESVTFKVGTQVLGTAPVALVAGVPKATWTGPLLEPTPWGTAPTGQMKPSGLGRTVTASFNNVSSNFTVTNATKNLVISKEDARATYTGTLVASTTGPTVNTVVVRLSAEIKDISATSDAAGDTNPGDIRNATVTFFNRDTGATISPAINVTLPNSSDTQTGTVTFDWTANIGTANTQTFRVGIMVDNYYTRYNSTEDALVTVSRGIATGFTTGGGDLTMSASGGLMRGDAGSRNNFGFGISYTGTGSSPVGHFNTMVRSGGVYNVKGTTFTSLVVNGKVATFRGNASIYNVTNGSTLVDGSATFEVSIADVDAGASDRIAITVRNGAGAVWFSSNWNGSASVEQVLAAGNLKLP